MPGILLATRHTTVTQSLMEGGLSLHRYVVCDKGIVCVCMWGGGDHSFNIAECYLTVPPSTPMPLGVGSRHSRGSEHCGDAVVEETAQ